MKKGMITFFLFFTVSLYAFALTEEEIFVEGSDLLLRFSLSNDMNEIQEAINTRFGVNIDLRNVSWERAENISESIKELMGRNNVNISMTLITTMGGFAKAVIVFRHFQDRWFRYTHIIIDDSILKSYGE
jgi:hypothetical protein